MATFQLCLLVCGIPKALAQDAVEDERLLKAVYIYNFAKLTRWPLDTWAGRDQPLVLCIAGHDELATSLKRLAEETIGGRPVTITAWVAHNGASGCHVVYVARSERERAIDVIRQVRAQPVLSISELPHFIDDGGIIQLYLRKDRIRFKINLAEARNSGLALSSRLLDLADLQDTEVAR